MDNKDFSDLDTILQKEGANEAFQHLSSQFNLDDASHIKQNWREVESLLLGFKLKKYRISQDYLFTEITIQPFKSGEDLEELKRYLLN